MRDITCPYCNKELDIETTDINNPDEYYEEECAYCGERRAPTTEEYEAECAKKVIATQEV